MIVSKKKIKTDSNIVKLVKNIFQTQCKPQVPIHYPLWSISWSWFIYRLTMASCQGSNLFNHCLHLSLQGSVDPCFLNCTKIQKHITSVSSNRMPRAWAKVPWQLLLWCNMNCINHHSSHKFIQITKSWFWLPAINLGPKHTNEFVHFLMKT